MSDEELIKEATETPEWEVIPLIDRPLFVRGYITGAKVKLSELEKENAELKKHLEMSNKVYNDNLDYSHHIEGQLTKAKELLAKWVELFKPKGGNIPPTPIQVDTEQFLKETMK